ncbi:MAG: hypothetical protein KQH59_14375 [Desulfobulbaceae bacterium]|nr:hypothetical protein [Desulfobulbaceae bacterium]
MYRPSALSTPIALKGEIEKIGISFKIKVRKKILSQAFDSATGSITGDLGDSGPAQRSNLWSCQEPPNQPVRLSTKVRCGIDLRKKITALGPYGSTCRKNETAENVLQRLLQSITNGARFTAGDRCPSPLLHFGGCFPVLISAK